MPAVIPPLQPPESSITWQLQESRALLITQTYHWLFLVAPVVIVSSLLVAALQCFLSTAWFSRNKSGHHPERPEPDKYKTSIKPESESSSAAARTQKCLRLRVYHLRDRWSTSLKMDKASHGISNSTEPTMVGDTPAEPASRMNAFLGDSGKRPRTVGEMATIESDTPLSSFPGLFSPGGSAEKQEPAAVAAVHQPFSPRPPPLPLSTSSFAFDGQESEYTASAPPASDVDAQISFIHQPNPDYTSDVNLTEDTAALPALSSPQRRTYPKSTPLKDSNLESPTVSLDVASGAATGDISASLTSPHSTTSSQLPPSPPAQNETVMFEDGEATREIGVTGEIISVLDDAGAGWKRHTRVYGGGVCLACLAAESGGGMYGDNVPLEDRR